MTQREFYEAIIKANIEEDLNTFAKDAIAKLDKTNEARKEKTAEKAAAKEAEKAPIREAIFAVITDTPKTASDLIAEAEVDIKPQAIPSLIKPLVEAGKVDKVDIPVKGKGKVRGYVLGIAEA